MVTVNDILRLRLSEDDIRFVLNKTLDGLDIAARDNLRHRTPAVQLDCLFRGYLGEYCIRRFFWRYGVHVPNNELNQLDDDNIDIDLCYQSINGEYVDFEVKTSCIPPVYGNIETTLRNADIKIIRRTPTIEQVKGGIHIQIYYDIIRNERDAFLDPIHPNYEDPDSIINDLHLFDYCDRIWLVAWIDKDPTLVNYINQLPETERTWHFGFRYFWHCPLNGIARTPRELKDFLYNIGSQLRKIVNVTPYLDALKEYDTFVQPSTETFDYIELRNKGKVSIIKFSPYIGMVKMTRINERAKELFFVTLDNGNTELWCWNDVLANKKAITQSNIETIFKGSISERIKQSIRDTFYE